MSTYNTISKLFISGVTAALLTACGGSSTTSYSNGNTYYTAEGEAITLGIDYSTCQYGSATQEGRVIDSNTNKGLKNVTVSISGCSVETDSKGFYKLSNIKSATRAPITFTKDGYYKNSEIISLNTETNNHLEYTLDSYPSWSKSSFESTEGIVRDNIVISDSAVYSNKVTGEKYSGKINSFWFEKNTNSEGRELFPGDYQGIDSNGMIVSFISYSYAVVEFKDTNDNLLTSFTPMTIKFDQVTETTDQIIPLWYYDYAKGIWIEEGIGRRDDNGVYICEISHPGTWSLSKPIDTEMGLYRGRIVDENDNPIRHVRLHAKGANWVTQDLTTDENGEFKVYVVPNKKFTLSAYDYKEEFGATFPGQLDGISAGNVIEE